MACPKGATVDLVRLGLPGWTRICHSDAQTQETDGGSLLWDLPFKEALGLAAAATKVRIQQRDCPDIVVESLPGSYPIADLRAGQPIGYRKALTREDVRSSWLVPPGCSPELVPDKLWHTGNHWHRKNHDNLAVKIYHCCDNGSGVHWDVDFCGWNVSDPTDLELYIDVE